jgi:hypothetical protein
MSFTVRRASPDTPRGKDSGPLALVRTFTVVGSSPDTPPGFGLARSRESFADQVRAAIATLGEPDGDPVADFLVDPGAACRALDAMPEQGGLVVRVEPEVGAAAPGYGPPPAAPLWIRVVRGAREVGISGLRGGASAVRRAAHVEIDEREEPCCDAPGCEGTRAHEAVWLALDPVPERTSPVRLLVAEQRACEAETPVVRAVAARLSAALGVPLRRGGVEVALEAEAAPPALGDGSVDVAELARFALRSEGEAVVVRDWDSTGPRASAVRNAWIGGALFVGAVAGWVQLWRSLREGGPPGVTVAAGVVAALLTLAGYAFVGVARFSARYRAACAPLVAVGRDRIVVLPWVGRDGAVDARPEGRLGAAIALGEVRRASPKPRRNGVAVELDTDHGPIDAMVCATAASAELWCAVLDRIVDEARHPRLVATARQRARQRAAAAV